MASFEVVEGQEFVQIALVLLCGDVPGGAAVDPETLVEERAIHALNETVGTGASNTRGAILDVMQLQEELVEMVIRAATELPTVVGENCLYGRRQGLVERQHPIVQKISGGGRHLRGVDLG